MIVDRIKQRAISWSTKFMSTAGRMTMLKSVLAVMLTYTMSYFKLPMSLCKKIQSALTRFGGMEVVKLGKYLGLLGISLP